MRKCEIDGCTNQHRARGLCIVHYNNWVRYQSGVGKFETKFRAAERERIIKLLESDPEELIDAGGGLRAGYETAIALIKDENRNITSEILPDGSIYIQEIEGGAK